MGYRLLSEKVARPHVWANRRIGFPLFLCLRESKFDMIVSFSVAWFELWPSCLVVLAGSCPVGLSLLCPGFWHLGWNQCSHGLSSRPLESCHHQCLKAVCGSFGLSQRFSFGASGWHIEAPTLYCYLYHAFDPHGFYQGLKWWW